MFSTSYAVALAHPVSSHPDTSWPSVEASGIKCGSGPAAHVTCCPRGKEGLFVGIGWPFPDAKPLPKIRATCQPGEKPQGGAWPVL